MVGGRPAPARGPPCWFFFLGFLFAGILSEESTSVHLIFREFKGRISFMSTKGKCKLCDVGIFEVRTYAALEKFLERHSIPYTFQESAKRATRRYFVNPSDLCCAQSVVQAIKGLEGQTAGAIQ